MVKTIYLMRHAKTEAGSVELADHARALTDKGNKDAEHMGEWIREQNLLIDKILCSTATRACQTIEKLTLKDWREKIEYLDNLYLASAEEILQILRTQSNANTQLFLIGHNPGFWEISQLLAGEYAPDASSAIRHRFKPGALAILTCQINHWAKLEPGGATLQNYIEPDMLN